MKNIPRGFLSKMFCVGLACSHYSMHHSIQALRNWRKHIESKEFALKDFANTETLKKKHSRLQAAFKELSQAHDGVLEITFSSICFTMFLYKTYFSQNSKGNKTLKSDEINYIDTNTSK